MINNQMLGEASIYLRYNILFSNRLVALKKEDIRVEHKIAKGLKEQNTVISETLLP